MLMVVGSLLRFAKMGCSQFLCGFFVGLCWVTGWLSFLAEPYWGTWWCAWILLATLLSGKVGFAKDVLSCIDSVAWNERGRIDGAPIRSYFVVTEESVRLVDADEYEGDSDEENVEVVTTPFVQRASNVVLTDIGSEEEASGSEYSFRSESGDGSDTDDGFEDINFEDDLSLEDVELNRLIDSNEGMRSRSQRW